MATNACVTHLAFWKKPRAFLDKDPFQCHLCWLVHCSNTHLGHVFLKSWFCIGSVQEDWWKTIKWNFWTVCRIRTCNGQEYNFPHLRVCNLKHYSYKNNCFKLGGDMILSNHAPTFQLSNQPKTGNCSNLWELFQLCKVLGRLYDSV